MFRTIFCFPAAMRLLSFSRRALLSSPRMMRPFNATRETPSTSLLVILRDMLIPPPPETRKRGDTWSRTRAAGPMCAKEHTMAVVRLGGTYLRNEVRRKEESPQGLPPKNWRTQNARKPDYLGR